MTERRLGKISSREVQVVASLLLLMCLSQTASAGVRCPTCQEIECGFEVRETLECAELPANHRLRIWVTCAANIPSEAFPTLVSASGEVFGSEWTQVPRQYTNSATAVYERSGSALPVGEVMSVRGPAPQKCFVAKGGEFVSGCSGNIRCLLEGSEAADCCSDYAERRIGFNDDSGEEPAIAEAAAKGREQTFREGEEYYRFVVGPPDDTPPPRLQVNVECGQLIPKAPIVGAISLEPAEMSDVIEVRIVARSDEGDEMDLRRLAAQCVDAAHPRRFNFSGVSYWEEGNWEFTAFGYDASGNVSQGPPQLISVPADCGATYQSPASIELACETPSFEVAENCEAHTQIPQRSRLDLCSFWQSISPGLGGESGSELGGDGTGRGEQPGGDSSLNDPNSAAPSAEGCGCAQGAGAPVGANFPLGDLAWLASLGGLLFMRRKPPCLEKMSNKKAHTSRWTPLF